MKKILLLVHEYYPCGSAITNCLNPIINEMKNRGIKVDVLTRRQKVELTKSEVLNNINVYRINDWFNIYNNKISNSKNYIERIFNKIILKFIWIYRVKILKQNEGFLNIDKTYKTAKKLMNNNKYDTVISCSYPFTVHKVVYKLKKDYLFKWIVYQFDPHTYNHSLINGCLEKDRLKEEIETLTLADKIFLPEENYLENIKTKLSVLKDKYCSLPFALISKPNFKLESPNSSKIIFVFAGTLYEKIRTPFNMFEFFKNVDFDYEIHMYYITEKVLEEQLFEYKKYFKNKLKLFSNKSKEECDLAISKANIILNIGNEMANQTPSKVYELISYGKPIINFYSISLDTSKRVLKKYPLVLNINKKYSKNDVKLFVEFCIKNKNKILNYENATKNYMTSLDVAKKFINEVEIINEK